MTLLEAFAVIGLCTTLGVVMFVILFATFKIMDGVEKRRERPRCPVCAKLCKKYDYYCSRCGQKL